MEEIVENECLFQEALNSWVQNHNKKFSDIMWFCIYKCCKNMMKSKANGIIVPDLESKAMDATIKIMDKILNHDVRPKKLSSYCYLWCIGELYSKKNIEWERAASFDDTFENYAYETENNIMTICKELI